MMCPTMETWASVAFMGLFLVSVCSAPVVPRLPYDRGERVALPGHDLEDAGELGLQDQEPLVLHTLVHDHRLALLVLALDAVPDGVDQALAAGEAVEHPVFGPTPARRRA